MTGLQDNSHVGNRIKKTRHSLGMTQRHMADKLGVSENYLSMLERGDRSPSLNIIKKISVISGTSVGWILYGSDYTEETNENIYRSLVEKYQPDEVANVLRFAAQYLQMEV